MNPVQENTPEVVTKQNKMPLVIGVAVVIILLLVGGIFAFQKLQKKAPSTMVQTQTKKKVVMPSNVIPFAERPFVQILPTDSKNVTVKVAALNKPADSVDYEVEYQTDSSLEGAQGTIPLSKLPAEMKFLLGTCSAGGACRYHTGVVGGTLLLKFMGAENYAVKQEWNYIENPIKGTKFSSKDAKFQLDSKDMASQKIAIIYNSPGVPAKLPADAISEAYSLATLSPLSGKASLTMRTSEESATAKILGWDGSSWKSFPSAVDGKTVVASVDLLPLYVVVKK